MRTPSAAVALLLLPASVTAQTVGPPIRSESAIQEMVRRQLESRVTELPPAPVPGIEAEALRRLPPLPSGSGTSGVRALQVEPGRAD